MSKEIKSSFIIYLKRVKCTMAAEINYKNNNFLLTEKNLMESYQLELRAGNRKIFLMSLSSWKDNLDGE